MTRRSRHSTLSRIFSASLVLGPLLVACKDEVAPLPKSSAPTPIVFGVSLDTTGSTAATGLALTVAVRAAEAQVNAVGGIGGRPVSFLFASDGGSEGEALRAKLQTELIDKGAIAILGPIRSKQVIDAAELTVGLVPLISPSATAVSLSRLNPNPAEKWVYRTIPSDATQVRAMIRFADQGLGGRGGGCKKLAIASAPDSYGEGFRADLAAEWPSIAGASLAAQVTLPVSSADDMGGLVREIAASDPDCLALIDVEDVSAGFALALRREITRQSTLFRTTFFVIGADGMYNDGFLVKSRTDPNSSSTCTAEGFFGTVPSGREDPAHAEYMVLHRQFEPRAEPDALASSVAGTYDAAALLLLARAASGSDDPAALRAAIDAVSQGGSVVTPGSLPDGLLKAAAGEDIDYKGASGSVNFTREGDVPGGYKVWLVQNGAFADVGELRADELQP